MVHWILIYTGDLLHCCWGHISFSIIMKTTVSLSESKKSPMKMPSAPAQRAGSRPVFPLDCHLLCGQKNTKRVCFFASVVHCFKTFVVTWNEAGHHVFFFVSLWFRNPFKLFPKRFILFPGSKEEHSGLLLSNICSNTHLACLGYFWHSPGNWSLDQAHNYGPFSGWPRLTCSVTVIWALSPFYWPLSKCGTTAMESTTNMR